MKKADWHWGLNMLLSFAAAYFFAVVIPVQTYLANRTLFPFPFADLAIALLGPALCIWMGTALVILLAAYFRLWIVPVVVMTILICEYLETGILSIGLPPLDGDLVGYGNPFRRLIDTGILLLVFATLVLTGKFWKSCLHWVVAGFLIMVSAALLDVRPQERASAASSELASGFCPNCDVVKSFHYSPSRNVLMFILDSFPATLAADIIKEHPELKKSFPGFVCYDNNIGMHYQTRRGLPGLMTGKYLEPEVTASEYCMSVFGPDSVLATFTAAGYDAYFTGSMLPTGYTNRRTVTSSNDEVQEDSHQSIWLRQSKEIPYVNLKDVITLRLVPYRWKMSVLNPVAGRLFRINRGKLDAEDEGQLLPVLAESPVSDVLRPAFGSFITHGVHPPVLMDENGKRLSSPRTDIDGLKAYGYYRLKQLAEYLSALRQRGLYDKSTILLTADHGCIYMKTNDVMHGAESALMWIKPQSTSGEFMSTDVPTSHCKIAPLLNAIRERDLSQSEMNDILRTDERLFRAKHGSTWYSFGKSLHYYDWIYDASWNLKSFVNRGVFQAN